MDTIYAFIVALILACLAYQMAMDAAPPAVKWFLQIGAKIVLFPLSVFKYVIWDLLGEYKGRPFSLLVILILAAVASLAIMVFVSWVFWLIAVPLALLTVGWYFLCQWIAARSKSFHNLPARSRKRRKQPLPVTIVRNARGR
jgi:hypothetical protein